MLSQVPWSGPEQFKGQHTLIPLFALSVQAAGNWPLAKWEKMSTKDTVTVTVKLNFSENIISMNAAEEVYCLVGSSSFILYDPTNEILGIVLEPHHSFIIYNILIHNNNNMGIIVSICWTITHYTL